MIKNSDKQQDFGTGAVRHCAEGKGRMDLLPARALIEVSKHYEAGAKRFGERNWEKGMPVDRCLDSALRHIMQDLKGDTDEAHLTAAAWNILCALDTRLRVREGILPRELDNRPSQQYAANEPINAADMDRFLKAQQVSTWPKGGPIEPEYQIP